jgi:hypothetical protein
MRSRLCCTWRRFAATGPAVCLGAGDQAQVGDGLAAVDVEEIRCGLEVRAGEAGVRVRAVLLGRRPQ